MNSTLPPHVQRVLLVKQSRLRAHRGYVLNDRPVKRQRSLNGAARQVAEWLLELYVDMRLPHEEVPEGMSRIDALAELGPAYVLNREPQLGDHPNGNPIEVSPRVFWMALEIVQSTLRQAEQARDSRSRRHESRPQHTRKSYQGA